MAESTTTDRQGTAAFLAAIEKSGLLSGPALARARGEVPADVEPKEAARRIIAAGLLTPFQADRLLAGRTDGFFLGPYLILEMIGRGGSGKVYKARHRTMNRLVAVKVLSPSKVKSDAAREAFQREARASALLVHPNIVTAFDANQINDRHYIVLEYVEGPTLDAAVRSGGPLPLHQACEIIRQTALALAQAHALGTAHGGLAPANLILTGGAAATTVKVLNFGLGTLALYDVVPDTGRAADAADYLAPEQLSGPIPPTPAADLFALGCTLYFALVGRTPVSLEKEAEDVAPLHQYGEVVRVEQLRPGIPPPLAGIVRSLMAKNPLERSPGAARVAAFLEPYTSPAAYLGGETRTATAVAYAMPQASPFDATDDDDDDLSAVHRPRKVRRSQGGFGPVTVVVGLAILLITALILFALVKNLK